MITPDVKTHWAMILFAMEVLNQQYNVIMEMSYNSLDKIIQTYLMLHPNKKKKDIEKVNRIKQEFDPVKVFGWKRK